MTDRTTHRGEHYERDGFVKDDGVLNMHARSWLPWRWDTRLPMKEDMRDIVMIAGEDPYAYKGTEDLNVPYVRPEK